MEAMEEISHYISVITCSIEHPSGSCGSQTDLQDNNVPVPTPPDFTCAGEWIVHKGEFGTNSFRCKWNLPEGLAVPKSTPMQLTQETAGINSIPFIINSMFC